jgi:hypothetical protein
MKIHELIHKLQEYPEEMDVQVLGFDYREREPWPSSEINFIEENENILTLEGEL